MIECTACQWLEKKDSVELPHANLSKWNFEMDMAKSTGGALEGTVLTYECRTCGSLLTRADIPSRLQACRWEFARRG
jgi:hypothetical protein